MPPVAMTPGADIHLLKNGRSQTMIILAAPNRRVRDIAPLSGTTYAGASGVVTCVQGTLSPLAVGDALVVVSHTDTVPEVHHGLLRVRVHAELRDLRFANEEGITIRAGSDDYVASVYATFDDLAIADVSGHDWLTFTAEPFAPFIVENPSGRLKTSKNDAGKMGFLHVEAYGKSHSVLVKVVDPLSTERPILKAIEYNATHDLRRNILFLAEGYPDQDTFEMDVRKLTDILFSSALHNPFCYLRTRFNVWSAFDALPTPVVQWNGITFGPAVNKQGDLLPSEDAVVRELSQRVGLPVARSPLSLVQARKTWPGMGVPIERITVELFEAWSRQTLHGLTRVKDTTYGFMFGSRSGGIRAAEPKAPNDTRSHLFPVEPQRTLIPDQRRVSPPAEMPTALNYNPSSAFADMLETYLESLRYGKDSHHPDFYVSRRWSRNGPDAGLVVFLVFDEAYGGTQFNANGKRVALATSMGNARRLRLIPGRSERAPGSDEGTTGNEGRMAVFDHDVNPRNLTRELAAQVLAHELSHALGLADEYENSDNGQGHSLAPDTSQQRVESRPNVTHAKSVLRADGKVDRRNVKWSWDRVTLASALATSAVPSGGNVTFKLETAEASKWSATRSKQIPVWLRTRELNVLPLDPAFRAPVGPFKIVDIEGDLFTLSGPGLANGQFPAGSVLYAPVLKYGRIFRVIEPTVLDDLERSGPFGIYNVRAPEAPELPRPNIQGYKYPLTDKWRVIGVYEGGDTYDRGVFRPSGFCKMREKGTHFCFVCKYYLINTVWPGAFDYLDRDYPE